MRTPALPAAACSPTSRPADVIFFAIDASEGKWAAALAHGQPDAVHRVRVRRVRWQERGGTARIRVYGALISVFAGGAVAGSVASLACGVHAIWLPAGLLAITLCLFIIDERHLR